MILYDMVPNHMSKKLASSQRINCHRISSHSPCVEDSWLEATSLIKCTEKTSLSSPCSLFESYLHLPDSRYLSLSPLMPSAWIMPCEWALHRQITCNNFLISLPWALSPYLPIICITEHPGYPCVGGFAVHLRSILDVTRVHTGSSSSNHKAPAGRGCMPSGNEGRGGRCPKASLGSFSPTVTLTRWREWSMEFCCIRDAYCSSGNSSNQVTVLKDVQAWNMSSIHPQRRKTNSAVMISLMQTVGRWFQLGKITILNELLFKWNEWMN